MKIITLLVPRETQRACWEALLALEGVIGTEVDGVGICST